MAKRGGKESWHHAIAARGPLAWSGWVSLRSRVDSGYQGWSGSLCSEAPPRWRLEAEGRGCLEPLAVDCVGVESSDMEVLVQVP